MGLALTLALLILCFWTCITFLYFMTSFSFHWMQLLSAPSATVAAPAAKNKLPQAEATLESNRSIMSFHSGKRKAPAELLQENKKKLNKAIRKIAREIQGLQTQENELLEERKKVTKLGQMVAAMERYAWILTGHKSRV